LKRLKISVYVPNFPGMHPLFTRERAEVWGINKDAMPSFRTGQLSGI